MKRMMLVGLIAGLLVTMVSVAQAGINYNSSRSNIYRLVYPENTVTPSQATAILAELEKTHQALPDESAVRKLKDKVEAVLAKHGVRVGLFKAIVIVPPDEKRKDISILLLAAPNDRARAIAITDEGAPNDPTPKPTKKK